MDELTVRAQLLGGMRAGRAIKAAGIGAHEGVAFLRAVAQELFPGAYFTRALTPAESAQLADEIERRLGS